MASLIYHGTHDAVEINLAACCGGPVEVERGGKFSVCADHEAELLAQADNFKPAAPAKTTTAKGV